MDVLKNWLTERDNATYCLVRVFGATAGAALIYKFLSVSNPDLQAFGIAAGAIGLAIAAKNQSERGER